MHLEIFIPTLNEAHRLEDCVNSIRTQNLPANVDVKVAIIDAGSTDATVSIAADLGLEVLDNSKLRDPEAAKQIGFKAASGDFLLFMDADMQCANQHTLAAMLEPMIRNPKVCAAFGKYVPRKGDVAINRALSMNALQCDPFYQSFLPDVDYSEGEIVFSPSGLDLPPIAGTTMYRLSCLRGTIPFKDRYFDVDVPIHMARAGFGTFWFAPQATFFHGHIGSLRELVRKRLRNLDNGRGNGLLTVQQVPRVYEWVALERFGAIRTLLRAGAAASGVCLIPQAMRLYKRYRDPASFMILPMGPLVAASLALGMLRSNRGREFLASRILGRRGQVPTRLASRLGSARDRDLKQDH